MVAAKEGDGIVWDVIQIFTPIFIVLVGYGLGMRVMREKPQTSYLAQKFTEQVMGPTQDELLYRFRESYARGDIELPALEKTVEAILQGHYGGQR
jgi:hypothetical protein